MSDLKLFSGNATPELANEIAKCLYTNLADATVDKFSDGEVHVQINECVRGCDTFIIQSTCAPTNDNLMELLVMVDALRRASAGRITAVIPYFGYARQDRRVRSARVPITAKVVADLLSSVGVDRVLTVDLHAEQIQGFFDVPVDNCYSSKLFVEDIKNLNLENPCIVSPDMGGVVRARAISKLLNDAPIAIIDKRRPRPNVSEVMNLIGEVKDKECIIVDDMIDTRHRFRHWRPARPRAQQVARCRCYRHRPQHAALCRRGTSQRRQVEPYQCLHWRRPQYRDRYCRNYARQHLYQVRQVRL